LGTVLQAQWRWLSREIQSDGAASPGQQIEDQDDHSYDQQKMNQAASNVKTEAQQPQYEHDHKNCPEHSSSIFACRAPEFENYLGTGKPVTVDC
jgi:hypothetical protein